VVIVQKGKGKDKRGEAISRRKQGQNPGRRWNSQIDWIGSAKDILFRGGVADGIDQSPSYVECGVVAVTTMDLDQDENRKVQNVEKASVDSREGSNFADNR
jgi:hypothetical protein